MLIIIYDTSYIISLFDLNFANTFHKARKTEWEKIKINESENAEKS